MYDGLVPVAEINSSGSVTAVNTFAPGGLVSRRAGTASVFYAFDPQGSVAERLDASGDVLGSYLFDAFGNRQGTDSTADPYAGFGGQWGYYADADTGLSLLGHRYYDSGAGRFLTRDPLGYAGGVNLYGYAADNPVNEIDPAGCCPDGDGGGSSDPLMNLSSFAAGFGHAATFGLIDLYYRYAGLGGTFNPNSGYYTGGVIAGTAVQALATDGAGAEADTAEQIGLHGPCFTAGTLVQMGDGGTRPIEEVKQGDHVRSRNVGTGQTEVKGVRRTFVHRVNKVVTVCLADASTGRVVQALTCTPQHPFYVAGAGFTPAGLLAIGSSIVTRAGPPLVVHSVERHSDSRGFTVYNFEVEGDHTYFVGGANGGAWVHNDCTDIAADIIKRRTEAGLDPGEVWNVQRPYGQSFGHGGTFYDYHDVVRVGDKIIDTFTQGHENPVEMETWMQNFDRAVGGDGQGFRQFFDFSPGSARPQRFAGLMAQ